MNDWPKNLSLVALLLMVSACGGPPDTDNKSAPEEAASAATTPAAAAPADASAPAALPRNKAPAGASVSITSPADGASVRSPFTVEFGIEGISLAPAGTFEPDSGHHHLLIDTGLPEALDQPIPKDEQHLHFGLLQSKTELTLPPGQHTLQLLLGDGNHVAHDPPITSPVVTITVK
jgi:hypothetical protein